MEDRGGRSERRLRSQEWFDNPEDVGMTATAFMSVSLDPPLVLVSLREGSRMDDLLDEQPLWAVSVLALTVVLGMQPPESTRTVLAGGGGGGAPGNPKA